MRRPPYQPDVSQFVARSPYLQLAGRRAATFVADHVAAAAECHDALRDYPAVRIEPLHFAEACLHSLGALDLPFLRCMTEQCTWRGIVWAAWLALLEPRREFGPILRGVKPRPENEWLVTCALAEIEGLTQRDEWQAFVAQAMLYREMLRPILRPRVPLRTAPTDSQVVRIEQERQLIRRVYQSEGLHAARCRMQGTLTAYYAMPYPRWVAAGALDPPQ